MGCEDKNELRALDQFLDRFDIIHMNEEISNEAVHLLKRFRLSHGLLIPDAMIAAAAIVYNARFATKNQKDYKFINKLRLLPYPEPF